MLIDARDLESGSHVGADAFAADVCIVGAGAAGITLALELERAGHTVVLLESGGFEFDERVQDLYAGRAGGTFLREEGLYLSRSRVRRFGGSTNHWNGWCRPLDAEDFEPREWIEDSGWPISRADLDPYYPLAAPYLDIGPAIAGGPPFLDADPDYETVYFLISSPTRFGLKYREPLVDSERVRMVLHANLVEMRAGDDGSRVERVVASTLDGRRLEVVARHAVLACGGVENARLLLALARQPGGVRPDSEVVGRFFLDHPLARVGRVTVPHGRRGRMLHFSDVDRPHAVGKARGLIRPNAEVERRNRWSRSLFVFDVEGWWHGGDYAKAASRAATATAGLAGLPGQVDEAPYFGAVQAIIEQRPNPASRVTLDSETDALGMPRANLDWRLTPEDERSIGETVAGLQASLGATFEGRMQNQFHADAPWRQTHGSSHHIGTTRMGTSASTSVVDAACRVHGVDNLHVAGSSVFATGGAANPTYTIVALAIRLADHLDAELQREVV